MFVNMIKGMLSFFCNKFSLLIKIVCDLQREKSNISTNYVEEKSEQYI